MKINRIFKTVFLQGLVGLGLFLGACSSLNETIPGTDLSQEEYTEVSIAIKEGEEMVFYDEDEFSVRYPKQAEAVEIIKNQLLADTITTQSLFGFDCVADDSYGWVVVCGYKDKGYCKISGTSTTIDPIRCYEYSNRSEIDNPSELELAVLLLPAVNMAREAPRKQG